MGILSSILGGGISSAVDSVAGLARVFVGDKGAKESNIHDEQIAAYDSEAAEATAQQRENRNVFDSLIDGLNRLPRPLIAFAVLGLMVWAPVNPTAFAHAMEAYSLVPQWLALVFGQVIALFFGSRMLTQWSMKPVDRATTNAVIADLKQDKPQTKETTTQYNKEMSDTSRPLSLPSIVRWNELHGKK